LIGVRTLREWMDEHLPPWLLGAINWPGYRLLGACWAEDCPVAGRRMVLHSRRQHRRCAGTPMAIVLNEARYADLTGEPVVPVSHAEPA
jgi:hypothetical protein